MDAFDTGPDGEAALAPLRALVRARFRLEEDAPVLICELSCGIAGCPPVETACAYWRDGTRRQFKILKPVAEVTEEDIAWLIAPEGSEAASAWDCC
jgi:hypothetical protein